MSLGIRWGCSELDARATLGGQWTLLAPLVYLDIQLGRITVPAGFATDLESIPRWLPIAYSLLKDAARPAGVLHDWLYLSREVGGQPISRSQADAVLYRAARDVPAPAWVAWTLWAGVRVGGWVRWRQAAEPPG